MRQVADVEVAAIAGPRRTGRAGRLGAYHRHRHRAASPAMNERSHGYLCTFLPPACGLKDTCAPASGPVDNFGCLWIVVRHPSRGGAGFATMGSQRGTSALYGPFRGSEATAASEMELFLMGRHDCIVQARRALGLADPKAESRPESRLRAHLVLDGLSPEVQFRVYHAGRWVATVDLAFPRHRLPVEYDGVWHGAPLQVGSDRERLNRLHAAGWEVVFVTREHLRDPHRMICTVRAAAGTSCRVTIGREGAQASMRPSVPGGER